MKLMVIYGSSRKNGNTYYLTKKVIEQLDPNSYTEVNLLDYYVKPIIDMRHEPQGFQVVNDDYEALVNQLMSHKAVLFVTPLYWYGMSGHLKNFIDRWTQSLRSKAYDFRKAMKGKKMYVIIVGGRMAPFTALPLVQQFQLISQFMEMDFSGYTIGKGVKPVEVMADEEAILSAELLGKKIINDFYNGN